MIPAVTNRGVRQFFKWIKYEHGFVKDHISLITIYFKNYFEFYFPDLSVSILPHSHASIRGDFRCFERMSKPKNSIPRCTFITLHHGNNHHNAEHHHPPCISLACLHTTQRAETQHGIHGSQIGYSDQKQSTAENANILQYSFSAPIPSCGDLLYSFLHPDSPWLDNIVQQLCIDINDGMWWIAQR